MPIRQLASDVAAKIAAGEVVERPASVVKELIENSIDAGATQIRVDLVQGGLQLIRVTDNGSGIPVDELPLALTRHATSKVTVIDDLEHIHTLGFRGEALASIAAVAEVTLLSRTREATQGAQVNASSGQISEASSAASPEGTSITVRNLFSAVPARLKFLKSRNTEVSHCHHLLEQYALAYPEIRFSVFSDNRQILSTPGDGQLSSVLVEVYGLQVAEQMVPLNAPEQVAASEYPVVSGYVSRPACYKSTRQHISFFVNRRWVLSRMLTSAIDGAYHSLLLSGRHPVAVINIQLDPSFLDVNVHPAKTEIRFLKERRVFSAILRAVREALLEEPRVPQYQPRQDTTQDASQEEQALDPLDLGDLDVEPEEQELQPAQEPQATPSAAPQKAIPEALFPQDSPWITVTEEEGGTPPMLSRLWQSHIRHLDQEKTSPGDRRSLLAHSPDYRATDEVAAEPVEPPALSSAPIAFVTSDTQPASFPPIEVPPSHTVVRGTQESQEPGEAAGQRLDPQQTRRLPRLRVIGQLSQSYIVTEGEDGLYLIDQHAAHERILLERMVAALKARAPFSQLLLTPIQLDLAPRELEGIEEHQQHLESIGFTLKFNEDGQLEVTAVPDTLAKRMNAHSLHELLIELTSEESLGATETWEERALANVACKAAIKANYFLTVSEMREMLEQLEQTRAPYSCCHGRPTMVQFTLSALEREFGRR